MSKQPEHKLPIGAQVYYYRNGNTAAKPSIAWICGPRDDGTREDGQADLIVVRPRVNYYQTLEGVPYRHSKEAKTRLQRVREIGVWGLSPANQVSFDPLIKAAINAADSEKSEPEKEPEKEPEEEKPQPTSTGKRIQQAAKERKNKQLATTTV